jgi:hypothetical protein
LLVGAVAAPPALANSLCNNGGPGVAGTADIALVQSVSALADGNYLDHLNITNYGPCSVPNVGLSVSLPSALVTYSSNPSSWTCQGTLNVACWETSTIGVPGTADVYLEFTGATYAIFACAATFSGPPPPTSCDPAGGAVPDTKPANNSVATGNLAHGESLVYGPFGSPTPNRQFDHTTSVKLDNGGLISITQAPECPAGVLDCFLGTITITTSVQGAKSWTLEFLASLAAKKSLSQITIWNSFGGVAFTALSNCSAKNATDPCVQNRSRSTNADGDTVYTIVVVGTKDNGMTAD